jgi:hypothetical protein
MKESIIEISELWENNSDFQLNELLRLTYHCYNVNPNHPFIPVLQSFCVKSTQQGLSENDQRSIKTIIQYFLLYPKPAV